jgi:hypothetical protein
MEYSTTNWNDKLPEEVVVFELHSLYALLLEMTDGRKLHGIRYPLALMLVMVTLAKLSEELALQARRLALLIHRRDCHTCG